MDFVGVAHGFVVVVKKGGVQGMGGGGRGAKKPPIPP